jgi:glycosyltransferase involved in cell wall biosynthesis
VDTRAGDESRVAAMTDAAGPELSIVIPVYNGADTIRELVTEISALEVPGGLEIVLVHDCGQDNSWEVLKILAAEAQVPMTIIDHSRNYGEHNTVMDGLRHARGRYVITMDDDLQNPPSEVLKLYDLIRDNSLDVVYAVYKKKEHAGWRNLGSRFANAVADWISDKPRGLYLSTFRCMSRFVVDQIVQYRGPFVYIDGLIFQVTRRADAIVVKHLPNRTGRSNYNIPRLIALWTVILVNFSVKPLRLSTMLGVGMFLFGTLFAAYIIIERLFVKSEISGYASLATIMLVFLGIQFLVLGLLGEYIGRIFLSLNGKPQTTIREVITTAAEQDAWAHRRPQ